MLDLSNIKNKITNNGIVNNDIILERSEEDSNSSSLSDETIINNIIQKKESIKSENNDNNKNKGENSQDKEKEKKEEKQKQKDDEIKNENENKKEENGKSEAFTRINEIKNKKRTMHIQFIMNEMSLSIKKIHPDLKDENFLTLVQKAFDVDFYMMANNDMLTILKMNNIYLNIIK